MQFISRNTPPLPRVVLRCAAFLDRYAWLYVASTRARNSHTVGRSISVPSREACRMQVLWHNCISHSRHYAANPHDSLSNSACRQTHPRRRVEIDGAKPPNLLSHVKFDYEYVCSHRCNVTTLKHETLNYQTCLRRHDALLPVYSRFIGENRIYEGFYMAIRREDARKLGPLHKLDDFDFSNRVASWCLY